MANGTHDIDDRIQITICGDGGCGKSSITLRLVHSQWTEEYDPTIEDSYSVVRNVDGHQYHLSLIDTAGQEEYRGIWAQNNLRSDAFLLVYDITQSTSLPALTYFGEMIAMESDLRQDKGMVPPVRVAVGNKCDLKEARQITATSGLDWARKWGCEFMETSAREMINVEETFALVVRRVVAARQQHQTQLDQQRQRQKSYSSFLPRSLTTKQTFAPASSAIASPPLVLPAPTSPSQGLQHYGTPQSSAGIDRAGYPSAASPHLYEKRQVEAPVIGLNGYGHGHQAVERRAGRKDAGFWSRLKCC